MWGSIINIGIQHVSDDYNKAIIKTINATSFVIFLSILIAAFFNYFQREFSNIFVLISIALVYGSCIFWNHVNKRIFSKLILSTAITFAPIINLFVSGSVPNGQYLGMIATTIISMFFASILLERKTEALLFWSCISYLFLYAIFFDTIFIYFSKTPPQIDFLFQYYPNYKIVLLLSLIIIPFITTFFKDLIITYRNERTILINKLEEVNNELDLQVQARTEELLVSREKIAELAFYTSHKVRGPITTILSTTNYLKDKALNDIEVKEILPKLHNEAKEMDKAIKMMNDSIRDEL